MAVEYFGHNVNGSDVQPLGTYAYINDNSNIIYTCPAGGKFDLKELGARVYTTSTGNFRIAIYTTSDALIAQGDAEIDSAPPGSSTWLSHTSFTDSAGEPISPQLDGGTSYKLIIAGDKSSDVFIWCDAVTSGWIRYNNTDLTGGFPSTITYGGNWDKQFCVRCGVEAAAAGGGSVAPVSYYMARRRN